ncbi:MAG: hypothetical protein II273_05790 [Lachnospiraceae bacterium]|nr:hypothetical protein [Lachnospiraceae bacterium]
MIRSSDKERLQKAEEIARQIWKLSRDKLLVNLRFLDRALSSLNFRAQYGLAGISCDGKTVFYDPLYVLEQYKKEQNSITRAYLHLLMHCIFSHSYHYGKLEQDKWDLAVDVAVENAILELGLSGLETTRDEKEKEALEVWKSRIGVLTAEKIYRRLLDAPLLLKELQSISNLFFYDRHTMWEEQETIEITTEEWKKISERIKAELKSFSKDKMDKKSMIQNLEEATKEHYDYGDFLRRFSVNGEDMLVNDDEFDYVYYTYGLQLYGNLPLVEPLEYKDVNKIKEFVIAIDTSASCRGKVVQAFLNKTYSILKSSENFFRKVNIHIIQCDSQVQSDTKITCDDDFEAFMKQGKLEGFGSTDFRPVFTYVNQCIERGEFENLKGLIYFTDGYGVFPSQKPSYDTAFVFLENDLEQPEIPAWAIKLVLSAEEIRKEDMV